MLTWKRYFYKQILKNCTFFLVIFYGLYVLIDFASHLGGSHYHHSKLKIGEFIVHYLAEFSVRAEILIPFALLIGTIHTLCTLNAHSELSALLTGGYSIKQLLRPFLTLGLCATLLLYLNNEFFVPFALYHTEKIDSKYTRQKNKNLGNIRAENLFLEDGSVLIYRDFDPANSEFLDVYWIPSNWEVYRIGSLKPFTQPPQGASVDHFQLQEGVLAFDQTYPELAFKTMQINAKKLSETLAIPKWRPLSLLFREAPSENSAKDSEKAARHLTALDQKLALPWLALIAVLGPIPYCIRFSRNLPVFFIFCGGIFGLVAIYMIMNAVAILGERQVLPPSLAILAPMGFFLSLFLYKYSRIKL